MLVSWATFWAIFSKSYLVALLIMLPDKGRTFFTSFGSELNFDFPIFIRHIISMIHTMYVYMYIKENFGGYIFDLNMRNMFFQFLWSPPNLGPML
jgi:hypothetical protein